MGGSSFSEEKQQKRSGWGGRGEVKEQTCRRNTGKNIKRNKYINKAEMKKFLKTK